MLDDCDAARHSGGLLDILTKLTSTQELRVLCTAQMPLGLPNERVFDVLPLQPEDAARLFKDSAHELTLTLTLTLSLTLSLTVILTPSPSP